MRTQLASGQVLDGTLATADIGDKQVTPAKLALTGIAAGLYSQLQVNDRGQAVAGSADQPWSSVTGNPAITGTANQLDVVNGDGHTGTPTISLHPGLVLPGTEKFTWPAGTTAQRPASPANGDSRLNTTLGAYEQYYNGTWYQIPKTSSQGVVSARRTTTYTSTTTAADLTYDVVDLTSDATVCMRHATNTSQFVAVQAGTYLFLATNTIIAAATTSVFTQQFKLNGTTVLPQSGDSARTSSTTLRDNITSFVVVNMNAGDYVTSQVYHTTSASTIQIGSTIMMLRLTGAQGAKGQDGAPGGQSTVYYNAVSLDNPTNANWAVNLLAPSAADTANAALTVRTFDDTAEEGVGLTVYVPPATTTLTLAIVGKAATAPATAKAVITKLYSRVIGNNVAVASWSAGTVLTTLNIPANAFYQTFQISASIGSLGLTAGLTAQLELTRAGSNALDTLVGDFHMLNMSVSFS